MTIARNRENFAVPARASESNLLVLVRGALPGRLRRPGGVVLRPGQSPRDCRPCL